MMSRESKRALELKERSRARHDAYNRYVRLYTKARVLNDLALEAMDNGWEDSATALEEQARFWMDRANEARGV